MMQADLESQSRAIDAERGDPRDGAIDYTFDVNVQRAENAERRAERSWVELR